MKDLNLLGKRWVMEDQRHIPTHSSSASLGTRWLLKAIG